jgi:pilus assembly protein CpaB
MNLRRISMVLAFAFVVSGLFTVLLSRRTSAHAAERTPESYCVTAAIALEPGHPVKAEDLKLVAWPAASPITGSFTSTQPLVGRLILYPVEKDQPVTDKVLASAGSGIGLAGAIPAGMRAIALRSDEVMGVAGFLFPGSHVDVLVTYRTDKSPEPLTLTVLEDVEVIAAGQKSQPDPEGKPLTATVVTLLLNPDDAQKAVLASTQGAVHFILRNGSDKEQPHESPIGLSQLRGSPDKVTDPVGPERAPRLKAVPIPSTVTVETISGEKISRDVFRRAP